MYNNLPQQNSYFQSYNQYPRYTQMEGLQTPPLSYPVATQVPSHIKGRPVVSIEEARAAQIDLDGSIHVFTDIGNKKIYTKQLNPDGTASLHTYSLVENEQPNNFSPNNEYITREEFEQVVAELRGLSAAGADKRPQPQPVNPAPAPAPVKTNF